MKNSEPWQWNREQQAAFEKVKEMLTAPNLLVYYDDNKPLVLACDASPYGVGAVLSHVIAHHTERLIAYASCSLNPTERKYSQLDKGSLPILFGGVNFKIFCMGDISLSIVTTSH